MVAVEVQSGNRSPWHSLIRFSISPRTTTGSLVAEAEQRPSHLISLIWEGSVFDAYSRRIIGRYADDVGASAVCRLYTSKSPPSPPSLTAVRLRASAIGIQASPSAVLRRHFISGAGV